MKCFGKSKKRLSKYLALLTAILFGLCAFEPAAITARADESTLNVSEYVTVSGKVEGTEKSNNGTYKGVWKAVVPMGKLMAPMRSKMSLLSMIGAYPHGKDGASTIAYIDYTVTFPEGVKISNDNIKVENITSMFDAGAFSHEINGTCVRFKCPLIDGNWKAVYDAYTKDGGENSDKTITFEIPYEVSADSYQKAKEIEKMNITANGDFETHASGSNYNSTKQVYQTDVSTKALAKDFSSSNIFVKDPTVDETPTPKPNPNPNPDGQDTGSSSDQTVINLSADLKLGENANTGVIIKKKTDELDFVGVLDVKAIKDKLESIEDNYKKNKQQDRSVSDETSDISLSEVQCKFEAKLELDDGLEFVKDASDKLITSLDGANNKFEIKNVTQNVTQNDRTVTVELGLVNEEQIKTFKQLKEAVMGCADELKVHAKAKFAEKAEAGTEYKATGSINGNFSAKANNALLFSFNWVGKKDNNEQIQIAVKYPGLLLPGDLLVNDDTQHNKVYVATSKDATLKMTGRLDVTPIKTQLVEIEKQHDAAASTLNNITVSDLSTTFTAVMTLPNEMSFTKNPKVELKGANGQFKISAHEVEGQRITVTMTLTAENVNNYKIVKDAVEGVDANLDVEVTGVMFNDKAKANTNYTIKGEVSGKFSAKAKFGTKEEPFEFNWLGTQMANGADSTAASDSDAITLTLKYGSPSPAPAPVEPEVEIPYVPSDPTEPVVTEVVEPKVGKVAKTGEMANTVNQLGLIILAAASVVIAKKH